MFDFKSAIAASKKELVSNHLFLLLLGASGSGKSYAVGTLGEKTLYLYTKSEDHGPKTAAMAGGANIVPVSIDSAEGEALTADEGLARLNAILDDVEGMKAQGFKAVVIDSLTELEALFRGTTRMKAIVAKNKFGEGPALSDMFKELIIKLKGVQTAVGAHVILPCALEIKRIEEDGLVADALPKLYGYMVSTGILQSFGDIMIIGEMVNGDKTARRFQLRAKGTRTGKSAETGVSKTFSFSPRLVGVDLTALPDTLPADLSKLVSRKAKKETTNE